MKSPVSIRSLYSPVQPAAAINSRVEYTEYAPDARLQNLIYCYWELKTRQPLDESFNYHVVTDGCIDLFFDTRNPSDNYVMGFSTAYTRFPLGRSFHYAGVRFRPGAFPQMIRTEATELTDRFEHLSHISPEISSFISKRFGPGAGTIPSKKELLDQYFLQHLHKTNIEFDPRITRALQTIFQSSGNLRIREQLDPGISNRQLCRLFNTYIGGTPKTFSKIVRFQKLIHSMNPRSDNIPYWDAGYFDQAHFIKDFKTLSGLTPSAFMGR